MGSVNEISATPSSDNSSLRIGAVSTTAVFLDIDGNLENHRKWVEYAANQGSELVCFPELSVTGYAPHESLSSVACCVPGPATAALEKIAKHSGVTISAGVVEEGVNCSFISQVLVSPCGYLGHYRKMHPTVYETRAGIVPGIETCVMEVSGFRVGINICYDSRFEDTLEMLINDYVDVVLHPHGNYVVRAQNPDEWTSGKLSYFPTRAIATRAYHIVNNSAGSVMFDGQTREFGGGALIVDPLGQAVARTTARENIEQIVYATVVKPLSRLIPDFELTHSATSN